MSTEPNNTEESPNEKVSRRDLRRFGLHVMLFLMALSIISYFPATYGGGLPRWAFQLALIVWAARGFK